IRVEVGRYALVCAAGQSCGAADVSAFRLAARAGTAREPRSAGSKTRARNLTVRAGAAKSSQTAWDVAGGAAAHVGATSQSTDDGVPYRLAAQKDTLKALRELAVPHVRRTDDRGNRGASYKPDHRTDFLAVFTLGFRGVCGDERRLHRRRASGSARLIRGGG